MQLENLVDVRGPFAKAYRSLRSETIQQADEIILQRITNQEMREYPYYTANVMLYQRNKNNSLTYKLGGRKAFNIVFGENVKEAQRQLQQEHNYKLTPQQARAITNLGVDDLLEINPADLKLKRQFSKRGVESCYFEIDTNNYDQTLNNTQRALAERVFGQGDAFDNAMTMIREHEIKGAPLVNLFFRNILGKTTGISVLNPEYVREHVKKGEIIARLCYSNDLLSDFSFSATIREVNPLPGCRFRGRLIKKKISN